jgi:endonuclease/exonuclease/phosphatase family metal-dependent hydrolase
VGAGKKHACALLSRWPIIASINHAALVDSLSGCFLEATVEDPAGTEWPVGVVHLPAGASEKDEDARFQEMAIILDRLKEHRRAKRPHLLCGDFNSNAPYQRIDPTRCKIRTQIAWKENGGNLPRRVVEAVTEIGYVDTYRALHDEELEMIGSFDTQHPGQRVDYIFGFGIEQSNIMDARVEQDRLAKYASDHYPIFAEIR